MPSPHPPIRSIRHPLIQTLRNVLRGKGPADCFVVEGRKVLSELLVCLAAKEGTSTDVVRATLPSFSLKIFLHASPVAPEDRAWVETVSAHAEGSVAIDPTLFPRISELVSPSPFLAIVERGGSREGASRGEPSVITQPLPQFCWVLCDRLQDPGNAGTLLRTAEAFGVDGVFFSTGSASPFGPKVVRGSMGAIFHLPTYESVDLLAVCRAVKGKLPIYATDVASGEDYREADFSKPFLLLVGNEGEGLAPSLHQQADHVLHIPMVGKLNSLNASVATAILLSRAAPSRGTVG